MMATAIDTWLAAQLGLQVETPEIVLDPGEKSRLRRMLDAADEFCDNTREGASFMPPRMMGEVSFDRPFEFATGERFTDPIIVDAVYGTGNDLTLIALVHPGMIFRPRLEFVTVERHGDLITPGVVISTPREVGQDTAIKRIRKLLRE